MVMLAGVRFKQTPSTRIEAVGIRRLTVRRLDGAMERVLEPPAGGRIGDVAWPRRAARGDWFAYTTIADGGMALHLFDVTAGTARRVTAPGLEGKLDSVALTHDGRHLAFTVARPGGLELWIADTERATARRVEGVHVNHASGGFAWSRGAPPLIVRATVPAERPEPEAVPRCPVVQETSGRAGSPRTYQDLLKGPEDEALFEYYFRNRILAVGVDGRVRALGAPGLHSAVSVAPGGRHLLVTTVLRPYSYLVPHVFFPRRIAVWDLEGREVARVAELPLRDNPPSGRDAVLPGVRSVTWRADQPATLVIVSALDGGDPRRSADKRDRVALLAEPFRGDSVPFIDLEMRFSGVVWAEGDLALVTERSTRTARTRTWVVRPDAPTATARRLFDRSTEDRYGNPGDWVLTDHPTEPRQIPLRSEDGRWLYLTGEGAAADGARPFLDRIDPWTGETRRLWRSEPPHFERVAPGMVLDRAGARFVFSRESPTQRPDLYLRDGGAERRLTTLPDPAPWFSGVTGERVRYRRVDGVELSATLYLPPGYEPARDGRLPFLLWAYPREFLTEEGASQQPGSPLEFRRPARSDHLLLLTQGIGVLDSPTMPIVGRGGAEPNDSYVEQLVASAQAAVDMLVDRGVGDRARMAVGGHSYGAFMTANLLAHSDLFRTGIARSGAYNRTLTPFGFQAEPRTYWQAPDVYHTMSPFGQAHRINEPILLIHGMRDSNSGTFPIQTERFYAALQGNGKTARYVQLPLEGHGYTARESRRHVLWEMITWLERHLKGEAAKPAAVSG
jgi:dipeptidyl aminopeptidase/acylaminoacyl peptidase